MTTTPTGRLRPDAHAVSGRGRLRARRLAVAGNRSFAPGAGAARRAAIDEVTRTWLTGLFEDAGGGGLDGVALAAVGSLGRHESGPLSDLDLVLLHDGRALGERALGELADRLWYPLWESGLKLDHSVRTVRESRRVADVDLPALVGLLELDRDAGDEPAQHPDREGDHRGGVEDGQRQRAVDARPVHHDAVAPGVGNQRLW